MERSAMFELIPLTRSELNMLKEFDTLKLKYTYSEYPGGHTWPVWRNNLYNFAQLLFNK